MSSKAPQGIRQDKSKRNRDQVTAARHVTTKGNKFFLSYGGSGGGKSYFWMDIMIERAMLANNSRHAVFRLTRSSCEKTLFDKTLHEVLDKSWPGLKDQPDFEISLSTMTVTFPNGSKLFFDGLDENRMTKVLGDEFNTIWINECNEDGLTYGQVSTLLSRLRAKNETITGKILTNKMFFDCNPRFYSDWEYKAFIQKVNPEDGDALHNADQWIAFKMEPDANRDNLHEDYIDSLMAGSAASRRRYVVGEWSDENANALFTEAMFRDNRIPRPQDVDTPERIRVMLAEQGINLVRTTIAVDPAKSNNPKSDLTGITVQGISDEGHVYVLADYSRRDTPVGVCENIRDAYITWDAKRIVVESNAAGTWLDSTMNLVWPQAPGLKNIAATGTTGGKTERAEPVAAQYERGRVHHVGTHKELEQQLCDWGSPASRKKSPDRMDALVWGITELMDLAHEKKTIPGYTPVKTVRLR